MSARGAVDAIWGLGFPDSFEVPNYSGYHAALYDQMSTLAEGGLSHYVSRVKPGERVLDLGCGAGRLAAKLVAQGNDVVGVDAAPSMLQRARARVDQDEATAGGGGSAAFAEGDIRDWCGAGTFDVVAVIGLTFSLFDSVADRHAILGTAARNAQPGGRVLVDFLQLDGVQDSFEHSVIPVRIGTMRGFTLVETRLDVRGRRQIADLYTELTRSDGQLIRLLSTTTSTLLEVSEVLDMAAAHGLRPLSRRNPVERHELGSFIELEVQQAPDSEE